MKMVTEYVKGVSDAKRPDPFRDRAVVAVAERGRLALRGLDHGADLERLGDQAVLVHRVGHPLHCAG